MRAIPAAPLRICEALDQLSESTWLELEQGVRTTQVLGEESVTDYNLMRFAACVSSVIVEKHSKRRESKSGADWELWTGRSGAFVGLRLQAKVLHHHSGYYNSLYSTKNSMLTQLDKLINGALNAPRAMYPLLTFYNFALGLSPSQCAARCPRAVNNPFLAGWTVASASAVRQRLLVSPSKHLRNLVDLMLPISCLFCCPADCSALAGPRPPVLAEAVAARLSGAWPDAEFATALRPGNGPEYVERLFKGERADTGLRFFPTPIRRGFIAARNIPRDISRVVIVRDQREGV